MRTFENIRQFFDHTLQMQARAEANQRNETLLKQNQDLMMQMKQMRHEIDDLKLSTLSKVSDRVPMVSH